MNFDDERFVKIYPRNTTNWKLLGWEGRMWDDCDGSGVLPARRGTR